MDYYIFKIINNLAGQYLWLDTVAIFFAAFFQYALGMGLIFFMLAKKDKAARRQNLKITAFAFLTAIVSRLVFAQIFKVTISRLRPGAVYQVTQLISFDSFGSFPSGHMVFFFALSLVIYFYNKKLGWLGFAGSFLIGLARIFGGIHYPLDILGGMVLGILVGWGSYKFFGRRFIKISSEQ